MLCSSKNFTEGLGPSPPPTLLQVVEGYSLPTPRISRRLKSQMSIQSDRLCHPGPGFAALDVTKTDVEAYLLFRSLSYPVEGEKMFPDLPPLHHGHSDIHLRNGIMNASRSSAANEPDAEKAFFVADLSQVYRQFQRWRRCMPEIQPFYGESYRIFFSI